MMLKPDASSAVFFHSHSPTENSNRTSSCTELCKASSQWISSARYSCNTLLWLTLAMGCNLFYSFVVQSAAAMHGTRTIYLRSPPPGGGGSPLEDRVTAPTALGKRKKSATSLKQNHIRRLSSRSVRRNHHLKEGHEKPPEKAKIKKARRRRHGGGHTHYDSSTDAGYEKQTADRKAESRWQDRHHRHGWQRQWLSGREPSSKRAREKSKVKWSERSDSEAAHDWMTHPHWEKIWSTEEEEREEQVKAEVSPGQQGREWKENEHVDKDKRIKEEKRKDVVDPKRLFEKEFPVMEKLFFPNFLQHHYYIHPLFWLPYWPFPGGNSDQWRKKRLHPGERMMRNMNTIMASMLGHPRVQLPFAFSDSLTSNQASAIGARDACRVAFTLNPRVPMGEVRLYMTPATRTVGLAADRKVKRSKHGRGYYGHYGSEMRVQAAASVGEECMLSKKLVKAGLIGWSYAGQARDGSNQIVVTFPSVAHATELLGGKWVTDEAYRALLIEDGLETLTSLERCLLSGRTHSECDQLRAEAGDAKQQAMMSSFSSKGYCKDEIRLPRFVYT